jgi:hypothetical protein
MMRTLMNKPLYQRLSVITLPVAAIGLVPLMWIQAGASAVPAPAVGAAAGHHHENVTVCVVRAKHPKRENTAVVPTEVATELQRTTLSYAGPCAWYGAASALGDGTVRTYTQRRQGVPLAIGAVFPSSMLTNLPADYSDGHHCFDVDGNGSVDPMMECAGGYERPLNVPVQPDVPVKWALVNWNSHGHGAMGVYTYPHFDFHFYVQSKAERDAIRVGPCGIVVNCDDYATGAKPLPSKYFPAGYSDIGAVEVAMGNHLVDQSGPEWQGQPFMRTFVYGAYNARISFLEPMISLAFLNQVRSGQSPSGCYPISQPQRWQQPGWYPSTYCVRYRANRDDFTVSIESFQRRG